MTRLLQSVRAAILPLGAAPVAAPPGPARVGTTTPLRVLLAEDNAVNQRLGRLMLEKLGHHVDIVGNGREAAEAVRNLPYDVVLRDIEMPEMDGLEATRTIRDDPAAPRQPQIVALTASAVIEVRDACVEAGMDDFLTKPVRLQDLSITLDRVATEILADASPLPSAP